MAPLTFNHWSDEANWKCVCSFPVNDSLTDNELADIVTRRMKISTPNGRASIIAIQPEFGGVTATGTEFHFYDVELEPDNS